MSPAPTVTTATAGCGSCDFLGRKGSCARLRCYCGHKDCWAFTSFVPLERATPAVSASAPTPDARAVARREVIRQSWDTREEDTWIDKV